MKRIFILIILDLSIIHYYSFADIWSLKANYGGISRKGAGSFSIGNKGYVGAGVDITTITPTSVNDFWEYDPVADTWTQKADYPGYSGYFSVSFSINGLGYMGLEDSWNHFWEYNPTNNIWTQKANYPGQGQAYFIGFSIGNKGYVGTGLDFAIWDSHKDFWEYDPVADTWTPKADFAGGSRELAVAFTIGNKGYVGLGDSCVNNYVWDKFDFWSYNPISNIWSQIDSFPGSWRGNTVSFSMGTKGYFGTGFINGYYLDFWEYDTITGVWSQKTNFPYGIWDGSGFTIGNKGYVYTGDTTTNQFYEYDPDGWAGIEETKESGGISVYPNPANTTLSIHKSTFKPNQQITITDVIGNKVYSQLLPNTTESTIDITNLSNGIYFYEVSNKEGSTRGKFVVQH